MWCCRQCFNRYKCEGWFGVVGCRDAFFQGLLLLLLGASRYQRVPTVLRHTHAFKGHLIDSHDGLQTEICAETRLRIHRVSGVGPCDLLHPR